MFTLTSLSRAQYGTTKYCSAFLQDKACNNRNCTFLHETGDDNNSFSRQDLSSMNASSAQRTTAPPQPRPPPQPAQSTASASQPMRRQGSKDESNSRSGSTDASALPSSASWANKDTQGSRTRRTSQAASRSSPSPKTVNAAIVSQKPDEPKREGKASPVPQEQISRQSTRPSEPEIARQSTRPSESGPSQSSASRTSSVPPTAPPPKPEVSMLDSLVKQVESPDFKFEFSSAALTAEEVDSIENHPSLIDAYGGVKRRAMREKEEAERIKREADAQSALQSAAVVEDDNPESGSLQLGGEPEEAHDSRTVLARAGSEPQSAIQPPSQNTATSNLNPTFTHLNINGRSLTPHQQQQLMLLKSNNGQFQQGFGFPNMDQTEQSQQGLFQNQMPHLGAAQGHARQSSRFSFANENMKGISGSRLHGQQSSVMQGNTQNPLTAPAPQHTVGNHFYSSGVQGPPPGLKNTGTPPISGGGMFAQGHGFTSNMNSSLGLGGANVNNKDSDFMRELMRGRNATSGSGGGQGLDGAKSKYIFPSFLQHHSPPPLAPAPGLLSSLYGPRQGTYHDPGPLKQKKKGKKHRHANTSSSGGGGVVDLADPSILQARMHQGGAGAGQGHYGVQGQGGYNPSNAMYGGGFGRW